MRTVMSQHLVTLLNPSLLERGEFMFLHAVHCLGSHRDLVENENILSHLHSSHKAEVVHCIYVRSPSRGT